MPIFDGAENIGFAGGVASEYDRGFYEFVVVLAYDTVIYSECIEFGQLGIGCCLHRQLGFVKEGAEIPASERYKHTIIPSV